MKHLFSRALASWQHARLGSPDCILRFGVGVGIGDDLLCTAVARELKKRGVEKIVMFSRYPSLFENNPDIHAVHNLPQRTIGRMIKWGYNAYIPTYFLGYDPATDHEIFPDEHLITALCRRSGITGGVALRPYMHLAQGELEKGRLFERQIVMHSTGAGGYVHKNWYPERFQEVCDALGGKARVVQLGLESDPPLAGAHDLRGKTTHREAAAILANSEVFVGLVGFLMHLARAVDCRGVIVYGGREDPAISGYEANENIIGPMPCAPCWTCSRCDFDRECMKKIQPGQVVEAALRQISRKGRPLAVGSETIIPG